MAGGRSDSSSSGEEDGDANWRANINSVVAATSYSGLTSNAHASATNGNGSIRNSIGSLTKESRENDEVRPQNLKHYQIKAQKLLDELLEKSIELVEKPIDVPVNGSVDNEGGVKLFRDSVPGIVFNHVDVLQRPTKRPRILPGKEIDEKSKKFKRQLQSVAVDGKDIIACAQQSSQKSLAKLEAREAAKKVAVKKEEERVAELKRVRGERWLPSMARHRQTKPPFRASSKPISDVKLLLPSSVFFRYMCAVKKTSV